MTKQDIEIKTVDGVAEAGLFMPSGKPKAGVILYMDIFGPRPGLDEMASRLAGEGYGVLVPDLFYRFGEYERFPAKTGMAEEASRNILRGMLSETSQAMTIADTGAFLDTLAAHGMTGLAGTVGYCMGGARALNAAAAYPGRVGAAASLHGGGLASDAPDSPHLAAASIKGRIYVGSAGVDASFPPEQSARLAQALREAEVDYMIENYVGMKHGWCVPDHGVFDPEGAERHWKRLITFFDEALG
ncbi:MAG: dienelactone hydrolase family protein [Pseudomonadota bacterium]|nr:dienelactone hydrolase family protein [Pseudomonadota bacterium]